MTRRKQKTEPKEVAEDEDAVDMTNDLDTIIEVPETVPEPVEMNDNDVLLPRSASRYVPPLR